MAIQVDPDPEDVFTLARNGQLPKLLTRSDQHVTAPPSVEPAMAEARSVTPGDLERRREELNLRQLEATAEERRELARRLEQNRRRAERHDLEDRAHRLNRRQVSSVDPIEPRPTWRPVA